MTFKREDEFESLDITDFVGQVSKINTDLIRLEPVKKALYGNNSLDMMFIIDCTASMSPWIEACKKEIKSIIEFVQNKFLYIMIRVSIVAYRDHTYGEKIEEVF